jgi:hypothetical protein
MFLGSVLLLSIVVLIWAKQVKTDRPTNLQITTVGLDELQIRLESPYGARSINHALIINDSSHHLLACELLFEFTTKTGEINTAQGVVAYTNLLKAKPSDREALFKLQPGIAAHSKLLFGMGAEPKLLRVSDEVPPLPAEIRTVENKNPDLPIFEKLVIRLNAVVIEDGRAFGPGAPKFLDHLNRLLEEVEK